MRRGLTSLVSSIDSALTRDDGRSDAASTASSDSDRYVVVGLAAESPDDADVAFRSVREVVTYHVTLIFELIGVMN